MLKLITDRTSSDISRAKKILDKARKLESLTQNELQEYMKGLKGCYNISDLNRVEEAVEFISNTLNDMSYFNKVEIKRWNYGDFFTIDKELPRYLQNIQNLRNSIAVFDSTPQVPESIKPYNYANDIEQILYDIEKILLDMSQTFVYLGVSGLGQNRLWQQRFRRGSLWVRLTSTLSNYNQEWNTVTSPSNETKDKIEIYELDNISTAINTWNNYMTELDKVVGII